MLKEENKKRHVKDNVEIHVPKQTVSLCVMCERVGQAQNQRTERSKNEVGKITLFLTFQVYLLLLLFIPQVKLNFKCTCLVSVILCVQTWYTEPFGLMLPVTHLGHVPQLLSTHCFHSLCFWKPNVDICTFLNKYCTYLLTCLLLI